jgi:hypothetical protein
MVREAWYTSLELDLPEHCWTLLRLLLGTDSEMVSCSSIKGS